MTKLFDKIYGCEACAAIGNSMGKPVEGWTWQKIEREHGFADRCLPGDRFTTDHVSPQRFGEDWIFRAYHREPGWTEDGMERYKLVVSAIIKKGGRITIEDLARDALDLARIKDMQGRPVWRDDRFGEDGIVRSSLIWDWGNEVAAAIAAAAAEALRPNATVDSIVEVALAQIPREGLYRACLSELEKSRTADREVESMAGS